MDLTSPASIISKSPEPETKIQPPTKPFPFTNGVLKRHISVPVSSVIYKECLKNHAASLGGHALDGCGEFMPSPNSNPSDPTSLKCAACGCHRNFHRRQQPEDHHHHHHPISSSNPNPIPIPTHVIEYQPHHRHHPPPPLPPPQTGNRSPSSASPPPISSSYYPSAPHMLLALSGGLNNNNGAGDGLLAPPPHSLSLVTPSPHSRKRFRTKFSQDQKEKMYQFAERVGWKMQKRDEDLVLEFCNDVGVDKSVLKVWMHNNKAKKDLNGNGNGIPRNDMLDEHNDDDDDDDDKMNNGNGIGIGIGSGIGIGIDGGDVHAAGNNGSSSSS